jgi:hypothetical protein
MQELLGMLGLGAGGLLTGAAYNKLGDLGDTAVQKSGEIADRAIGEGNFTGYGVTGGVGSGTVAADGSTQFQLDPNQQGQMDQMGALSQDFAGRAGGDMTGMQNDIYARIRAMQQPGEDRNRMELENRLQNQGRLGIQTNMYGGTPEALSMNMANAEARNSAAYQSIEQARAQQQQDGGLASMFGGLQFNGLDQLRQNFGQGNTAFGYKDIANRQNQNIRATAEMGGLDAKLASTLGQANLMGELGTAALSGGAGMFGSLANNGGLKNLGDFGSNLYSQIFG